jgi:SAM-dependent methyltransferase
MRKIDIRSLLENPAIYRSLQFAMGAYKDRQLFVKNYVKASDGDVVLDIGCGPADVLEHLPRVDYWGFDVDERYIFRAQQVAHKPHQIYCKEIEEADLCYIPPVDIVLMSGVLHHLSDDKISRILKLVSNCLKPEGRLVTIDPIFTPNQNLIAKYLINLDRGEFVRGATDYQNLVSRHFKKIQLNIRQQSWLPYTRCYMECTK